VSRGDNAAFVDRSLITAMTGGRYRFHALLKRYITGKTSLLPVEKAELEEKYCSWFLARFEDIYHNRSGRQMVEFLRQTDQTLPDLIHTATLLADRAEWGNLERMIQPLYVFFEARGMHRDGAEVFEYLLNRYTAKDDSLRCRMRFNIRAGTLLLRIQQFSRAYDMLQAGLAQSRELGDRGEEIRAVLGLSSHAVLQKKATAGIDLAHEALLLAKEISDEELLAQAYYNLAYAEDVSGDVRNAMDHQQHCRVICEQQGDWRRLSKVLTQLGDCSLFTGRF
jgi:tetratricopeptide (TPR) repeat protein